MPVNKVAKIVQSYPNRLWTIFKHWISIARKRDIIEDVDKIGFDETSVRKGHKYITTMVDLKQKRILLAEEGKGVDCIKKSVGHLTQKQVDSGSIKQVCIDMSPSFISGCDNYLPDADVTFDKFHVMKEVNKAMDELRKWEMIG